MNEFGSFGKALIAIGVVIALLGVIILFAGKIPGIGRLPGDIYIKRGNFVFYFPLMTSIILSIILTIIFALFGRR